MKTTGQQKEVGESTRNGQVQPTSKRKHNTKTNSTATRNRKHDKPKESKRSNQHHSKAAKQRIQSHASSIPQWCPIRVSRRGANNHPRQKSKRPIAPVDFAFNDIVTTPVLTSIDIKPGRISAPQFDCAVCSPTRLLAVTRFSRAGARNTFQTDPNT